VRPISLMAAPHLPNLIRRIIVDRAQVKRKVVLDEAAHQHDQENPARVRYAIRALYESVATVGFDVAGAALRSLGELPGLDPFMKEEVVIQGRTLAFAVAGHPIQRSVSKSKRVCRVPTSQTVNGTRASVYSSSAPSELDRTCAPLVL
jgi:hypothetical protein